MPKAEKSGSGPVLKREFSLQPSPQEKQPPSEKEKPDFWKMIQELTPEDWVRHEILLYQLRPKTGMS